MIHINIGLNAKAMINKVNVKMMIPKILKLRLCLLFLVPAASLQVKAQDSTPLFTAKNAIFLELGGNGLLYSLNYERMFYQKGIFKSAARIGLTTLPRKIETETKTYWDVALPLELVGLIGRSKHHLELGIGYTPSYIAKTKLEIGGSGFEFDGYRLTSVVPLRIGYRYQKPDGGFFFRAAYMPTLDLHPDVNRKLRLIHGGISLGKSF